MDGLDKKKKIKIIAIILAFSLILITIGLATGNGCTANKNVKIEDYTSYTLYSEEDIYVTTEYKNKYSGTRYFYVDGAKIYDITGKKSSSSTSATYTVYRTDVVYNGRQYDYCYKVTFSSSGTNLITFRYSSQSMALYVTN